MRVEVRAIKPTTLISINVSLPSGMCWTMVMSRAQASDLPAKLKEALDASMVQAGA
jgi:hypothetical protein